MRIVIPTCMWQRPAVFEVYARGIRRLRRSSKHEIVAIMCGSEGEVSESLARKHGFPYIEFQNRPLGAKYNARMLFASAFDPDYVLMLGSDDIISTDLLKAYEKEMEKGTDFMGILDLYIYNVATKQTTYCQGYTNERVGETVGVGRCLSRNLLQQLNWQPWIDSRNSSLDGAMMTKLGSLNYSKKTFRLKELDAFAMDIKSGNNISPFRIDKDHVLTNPELMYNYLPKREVSLIYAL